MKIPRIEQVNFRPIQKDDNQAIAKVIRDTLTAFGANKPGTVYTDPTTDDLFTLFQKEKSAYIVASLNNEIIGGCGIFPTPGLPLSCAELVKLYLLEDFHGLGIGKKLMLNAINTAMDLGYETIYLETMPELSKALDLYHALGFERIDHRIGVSGHHACDIWMLKKLR